MAYGGTPTTETVNLDEAPVAGACTFLPSIERVFVSLDLAACTYGVVMYAPGGEIGEPIRIFVVNAGPNIWSSFHVVGAIFDASYTNANPARTCFGTGAVGSALRRAPCSTPAVGLDTIDQALPAHWSGCRSRHLNDGHRS